MDFSLKYYLIFFSFLHALSSFLCRLFELDITVDIPPIYSTSSVFDVLSIGRGFVAAVLLCMKREAI